MPGLVAALAALCLGVAARAALPADAVATVNGKPILLSDFRREAAGAADKEAVLDEMIERELLVQQGEKEKISISGAELDAAEAAVRQGAGGPAAFRELLKRRGLDYGQFRRELARRALARKVVERDVKDELPPLTDGELHDYFRRINAYNAGRSTAALEGLDEETVLALREEAARVKAFCSERVRLSRILLRSDGSAASEERAKKAAGEVSADLRRGESFEALAQARSDDKKSAPSGGDTGYLLRGSGPPEVSKAAFALGVGQVSAPIRVPDGYEILRVTEKAAAKAPDFGRFKKDLARSLEAAHFDRAYAAYLRKLLDQAVIERRPA